MFSAVTRLSSEQSRMNLITACRSSCCAGMPRTMRRGPFGDSRTVLVWQSAQLNPICSTPKRRRREMPIGRSRPGSKSSPVEAYPPGRRSPHIAGSVLNTM